MSEPKVRYVRKIAGTPVEGLAWLAGKDQIDRGFRNLENNVPGINWDYEAVFIEIDGEVVAMISFKRQEWNRAISTGWSFTMPSHRQRGLNRTLFDAIKHIANRDGYTVIARGTHPENKEMRAAFEAAGGQMTHIEYRFEMGVKLDSINDRYEFP